MIVANHRFRHMWNFLMLLVITFTAIEAPLRLVTKQMPPFWAQLAELLITLLFALDVVFHFFCPILKEGRWVHDRKVLSRVYLKGWFVCDLIAALPLELILGFILPSARFVLLLKVIHLGRLVKLARLWYYRGHFEYFLNINSSIFRLVFFFYLLGLISHWISCGWSGPP